MGFTDGYAESFNESERTQAVETLREWLLHDTWTLREGLFLLVGIDPDRSTDLQCVPGGIQLKGMPTWARITKRPGIKLDAAGGPGVDGVIFEPDAFVLLSTLLRLWTSNPEHSSDWESRKTPAYFIEWAKAKGNAPFWIGWIGTEAEPVQPQQNGSEGQVQRHSLKPRRNLLDPIIERARSMCRAPSDSAEVWAALVTLAAEGAPPLVGVAEGEIKYQSADGVKALSRDALGRRLQRRR